MSYLNRITIRDAILIPDRDLGPEDAWQQEVPYDTRQFAIDQLLAAYKSCLALKKNGYIDTFDVKFKTKKAMNQIFQVNKKAIDLDKLVIFKSRIKKSFRVRKKDLEKLKTGVDGNFTILKNKPNRWSTQNQTDTYLRNNSL